MEPRQVAETTADGFCGDWELTNEETSADLAQRITDALTAAEAQGIRAGLLRAAKVMERRADQYAGVGATVHWDIRAVAREVAEMAGEGTP